MASAYVEDDDWYDYDRVQSGVRQVRPPAAREFQSSRGERAQATSSVNVYSGKETVAALHDVCFDILHEFRSENVLIRKALGQLQSIAPVLSAQARLVDVADDPEIAPMKGLIIGTLADIAVTLKSLLSNTKSISNESKAILERRLSNILSIDEVAAEVLDEPAYFKESEATDGDESFIEECSRDIDRLVSGLSDLQPVFHVTESRLHNQHQKERVVVMDNPLRHQHQRERVVIRDDPLQNRHEREDYTWVRPIKETRRQSRRRTSPKRIVRQFQTQG